jgi:hypothetical protein
MTFRNKENGLGGTMTKEELDLLSTTAKVPVFIKIFANLQ